jgi:hypothetical protein
MASTPDAALRNLRKQSCHQVIEISVASLTLTYPRQIYKALQQPNTFGLKIYLLTSQTANAAALIAGLGRRQRQFSSGCPNLVDLAAEMTKVKEMHPFYPGLVYFRFDKAYYSISRSALLALDVVALLTMALHDEEYDWLKESAYVSTLVRGPASLDTFGGHFSATGHSGYRSAAGCSYLGKVDVSILSALQRFRRAGIRITENDEAGTAAYISTRSEWEVYIRALAPSWPIA